MESRTREFQRSLKFVMNHTASTSTVETTPSEKKWSVGSLTYSRKGLFVLFAWMLWGDFAWSMRDRAIPPIMQILFKKYEVTDMMAGLLLSSLPLTLGLLTGPFISYLSDNLRSKWGRRIPFLISSTPFIALSIFGMAFSPWFGKELHQWLGVHSPGLNTSILISLGVFWMIFEFACGVAVGVFGGLINDVVPQLVVGRFYGFFRILSLIAGIIFSYWIFGHAEEYFAWIFIGVGLLYGVGFSLMCLNVKEGEYPPPAPRLEASLWNRFMVAAKSYFKDGYSHSYYLWFFALSIFISLSMTPYNLYNVFFAKSFGMSMVDYGKYQAITFVLSLCMAYPLGSLADRFHPLRMTMIALALSAIVMLWCSLHVKDIGTFAISIVANAFLAGCLTTVSASLPQRLLPRDKFAQIGSAGGTLGCIASIAFAPALGGLLDMQQHNYILIFYVAGGLSTLGLITSLVVHRKFMALGGPDHYVAPQ